MWPYHHAGTCTSHATPQPAGQDPQNTPSWQRWDRSCLVFTASPNEVLGFIQPSATSEHSLEDEVEAYLLDAQTGTSSIQYWQASPVPWITFSAHVCSCSFRKISYDSLQFLLQLWIFYPSKAQQSHVNVSFLELKRQCYLVVIASMPNWWKPYRCSNLPSIEDGALISPVEQVKNQSYKHWNHLWGGNSSGGHKCIYSVPTYCGWHMNSIFHTSPK